MTYQHLTIEEREKLMLLHWERKPIREIARILKRNPSTISRELRKNFTKGHRRYAAHASHERALEYRKHRGREQRLKNETIRSYVKEHLITKGWSPEQIAGRIRIDLNEQISHEAIYQFIYSQIRSDGTVKKYREDLRPYLKRRHKRRVKKGARRTWKIMKTPVSSIENRPAIVSARSRIGDWESDSVASRFNAPGLNTLVERKSGLVFISKLVDRTAESTRDAIVKRIAPLPEHARRTMTFDNGSENQRWRDIEAQTKLSCFFAHPYSSGERGTNENTNGLIRWYFPKRTDFRTISEKQINEVEYALNTRPRKRLGWHTPLEVFTKELAGHEPKCCT